MTSDELPESGTYVPIDCDQHSVLELLAMRRTAVIAEAHLGAVEPPVFVSGEALDVLTRDGAEYPVLLQRGGNTVSIRLDRLRSLSAGG